MQPKILMMFYVLTMFSIWLSMESNPFDVAMHTSYYHLFSTKYNQIRSNITLVLFCIFESLCMFRLDSHINDL